MKTIKLFFLLITITAFLISCGNIKDKVENAIDEAIEEVADEFSHSTETVEYNDLFSIEIPNILSECSDLNDEAVIQYENIDTELYLIVLEESKQEFFEAINFEAYEGETISEDEILDMYSYLQFTTFASEDESFDAENIEINNLQAKQLDATANFESYSIFYRMACYEGEDTLYFLVMWTLEDSKDTYGSKMQDILESFKEL